MVLGFVLVRTPGFLIWFDPFSTVPILSSTQNAPGFAFFGLNRVRFALLTRKNFRIFFVHSADTAHKLKSLVIPHSLVVPFLT